MPEMSEENYKMLLERLDAQDKKIEVLEKQNADIVAMNKSLIGRTSETPAEKKVDRDELRGKLLRGLKHAKLSE